MINSKLSLILLFVLTSNWLLGQIDVDGLKRNYDEGEISLKKNITVSFFYNEEKEKHYAKITHRYTKLFLGTDNVDGFIQLPFSEFEDIKLLKARFFKLDTIGEKILVENVKVRYIDVKDYYINNIFYSDLKVKQFKSEVDLPDNYLIDYSYDVTIKDLKFLSSIYFQNGNEAVDDVEIKIKKNENVELSIFERNLGNISKTETEEFISYSAKKLKRYQTVLNPVGRSYYLPHLILSVKTVKSNKNTENILSSTANLYAWYNSLIKQLSPNQPYIKTLTNSIIAGKTTDIEKIESIFKWVQENIQYIAFENGIAGFKPEEADNVAKLKYGDCKGMANLLVSLLNEAGFEASHTWIGTRSNNYNYSIPSLVVDNHMICALNLNDKRYFLDATSKSAKWNKVPPHIMGKEALVRQGDSYVVIKIPTPSYKESELKISGNIIFTEGYPKMDLNIELSGFFVQEFESINQYISLEIRDNIPYYFISKYLNGISIEKVSPYKISKNKVTFSVSATNYNIAKNSSIDFFPFLKLLDYPELKDHEVPSYIDFPHCISVDLSIENPNKRIRMPEMNKTIGMEDFKAEYSWHLKENKLQTHQKLIINTLFPYVSERESWNNFVKETESLTHYPIHYGDYH